MPYVFNEYGALMVANILRSERAIQKKDFGDEKNFGTYLSYLNKFDAAQGRF
jgi:hypothetical protein